MKKRTKLTLPSKYVLLIVTILCLGMIILSFTLDFTSNGLKMVTGYTLVPIQSGMNEIGFWISDRANSLQQLKDVMSENEILQEKVDDLALENNTLLQDKYELDRLRELYELDEKYPSYDKVAARIIAKDAGNWFNTFMIDKGSKDGLSVDMNVIAGSGLVGIITQVGPNWATVRSIIDDSSNVSGMVLSTSDRCIVTGDLQLMDQGNIRFSQLSDTGNSITIGDKIVTSHISSKYLQGILIGYISDISINSNNLTKSGYVTPVVDFEHLQEVLVITDLKMR